MNNEFSELKPGIVLGIAAHPDDLDVLASGTMAKLAKAGSEVHYLILTDGGKGTSDKNLTSEQLTAIRKKEQQNAADCIGAKEVHFLDYPDGNIEVNTELKKDLVKQILSIRPDLVITLDPSIIYSTTSNMINHPDHRATGQAALDAIFPLARDHLSFPDLIDEGYEPHKVVTLLLTNYDEPNYFEDITDFYEKKLCAILAHESQFKDKDFMTDRMEQMSSMIGEAAGYKYAEAFVRLDLW